MADIEWDWRWIAGIAVTILAFVGAGLYVATHGEKTSKEVTANAEALELNRDALVTVCSSLTLLGFVFEQLRLIDLEVALDKSLSPETRASVRQRASLYGTAVEALNETNKECEQIE